MATDSQTEEGQRDRQTKQQQSEIEHLNKPNMFEDNCRNHKTGENPSSCTCTPRKKPLELGDRRQAVPVGSLAGCLPG